MNYEYATSDCYDFIDRPRTWERDVKFSDRHPICYAFLLTVALWALIIGAGYAIAALIR